MERNTELHDYDTDNLNSGLQRTSAFHFLCFLKIHNFLINWCMTFIIYQKEPQLKAKTLPQNHSVPAKGSPCPDGLSAKLSDGKRDEPSFLSHLMDRNLRETKVLLKTTQVCSQS